MHDRRLMDISVTPAGAGSNDTTAEIVAAPRPVDAAPGSPLINLRAVRERKLAGMHLDLPVPRWEDGDAGIERLIVRYRPLNNSAAIASVEKRLKSKTDDWVALADADQLVQACVGVYVQAGGRHFTLAPGSVDEAGNGRWVEWDPKTGSPDELVGFSGQRSPELAAVLGLDLDGEKSKAAALVKAVYYTDGDMRLACQQLAEWSSKSAPQADEEALGE